MVLKQYLLIILIQWMLQVQQTTSTRKYKSMKLEGREQRVKWDSKTLIEYYLRWRNSTVPYQKRSVVEYALKYTEQETCLRFKEIKHFRELVGDQLLQFQDFGGTVTRWWTHPGIKFGVTTVYNSGGIGVALHELNHALGMLHETLRRDRDKYVFHKKNISKYWNMNTFGTCYDFSSDMHGGMRANKPKWGYKQYWYTGGSTFYMRSFLDTLLLNRAYCWDRCDQNGSHCQNGGYLDPNDCTSCKCPFGFTGLDCSYADNRKCPEQEEVQVYSNRWKIFSHTFGGKDKDICATPFKAPPGKRVEVKVEFVNNSCQTWPRKWCHQGEFKPFVEVKTGSRCLSNKTDFATAGYRFCPCMRHSSPSFVSETELMLIVAHIYKNRKQCCQWFNYNVHYRHVDPTYRPPGVPNLVPNGDHDGIWDDWKKYEAEIPKYTSEHVQFLQ